jgi:enediyne biosynthesis protein E4
VKTGSSYLSQSELPVTIGLGQNNKVNGIDVTWPNGRIERLQGVAGNQTINIVEGKGVVRTVPLGAKR